MTLQVTVAVHRTFDVFEHNSLDYVILNHLANNNIQLFVRKTR